MNIVYFQSLPVITEGLLSNRDKYERNLKKGQTMYV
jgi:hypothetical protein